MSDDIKFLQLVPIFSELTTETLEKISCLVQRRTYTKDQVILMEHESGSAFFIIISGKVKVFRESEEGKEVILTILSETISLVKCDQ
jgi:CRP/FNR family transcriptional regulator